MVNIQTISLTNDGQNKRISVVYDELDNTGKTTATNQRLSRVVLDTELLESIEFITEKVQQMIEEG